jgi:hypothetical protein
MFGCAVLTLLLSAGPPELAPTRAELDTIATRIATLKARQLEGENVRRELERLLVRAQELASEIESSLDLDGPLPVASVPSADELRERADAARDEADRLAAAIHVIDIRMATLRHELQMARMGAGLGGLPDPERHRRLRLLAEDRVVLGTRLRVAVAEASRLDAEANAIEGER